MTLPLSASITSSASAAARGVASAVAAQANPAHIRVRVSEDRGEYNTVSGPILSGGPRKRSCGRECFWRAASQLLAAIQPSKPPAGAGQLRNPPIEHPNPRTG